MRLRDIFRSYIEEIETRHARKGPLGLPTGYRHLDYHLNGFQDGRLYVIAGRPGMGKTALALNILRTTTNLLHQKKELYATLLFTLEMGRFEIMDRIVGAQGGIKQGLLQSGKVCDMPDQMAKLGAAASSRVMAVPALIK